MMITNLIAMILMIMIAALTIMAGTTTAAEIPVETTTADGERSDDAGF